ncbi:MAG TPA: hypothetical protein VKA84_13615 [Gemmatimonadaceae bacterium]|nr:hypothetical protein [Gemmatimonadaceae bacterium]
MTPGDLPNELDVLRDVSSRLDGAGIAYMLTGSMAMNFYALPRMTRDIDFVVAVRAGDADRLVELFEPDYYVAREAVDEAIHHHSSFNLIHQTSVVKVDCIPKKAGAYHDAEFERRRLVRLGDFSAWIATREDLVLSKLLWARESRSDVQLRDVRNLAAEELDDGYVSAWADRLGVRALWEEVRR